MCPQVYKRVKTLPCCYETLVDLACLWQRSPLCGLEQNLCYQEKKRRKVWSTEGTNYRIKRFLLSQSLNKKKCAKEWWRHWIPRSLRAEDNHVWALEENHVGGRPASQSSSRSLLLGKLGKWLNGSSSLQGLYHTESHWSPFRYKLPSNVILHFHFFN